MTEHHATVCIAPSLALSTVPEKYKIQSSDVSHILSDVFSIDEVRQLIEDSIQKPVSQEYRVFVVVTKKLPVESQNALLKLFEEPPKQTKFFLVIPQEGLLIPTLLSRVQLVRGIESTPEVNTVFNSFVSASYAERMATIANITKKKDLESIEAIMRGAEKFAAVEPQKYIELLGSVLFVRKYSGTRGASNKMLLEEIALSLPVVK